MFHIFTVAGGRSTTGHLVCVKLDITVLTQIFSEVEISICGMLNPCLCIRCNDFLAVFRNFKNAFSVPLLAFSIRFLCFDYVWRPHKHSVILFIYLFISAPRHTRRKETHARLHTKKAK